MRNKRMNEYEKGITLVALVVTIVVLLILAGISISLVLGNNGIITKATQGKANYSAAQGEEENALNDASDWIDDQLGTNSGSLKINKVYTKKTTTKDEYENPITIPEGFKVVNDDTTTAKHVNEGIVVADEFNNEFVWVPVGDVYTDATKNTKKTIDMNRYYFSTSPDNIEVITDSFTYQIEEDSKNASSLKHLGNTIALDIKAFVKSAKDNHGFYIGRYEARQGTSVDKMSEDGSQKVLYDLPEPKAATLCRGMYSGKTFTVDLANSYAWDTTLIFLDTFGNSGYFKKMSVNSTRSDKGTNNDTTKDVMCNIYDMASNCLEWTTETTTNVSGDPCTFRGGNFYNNQTNIAGCRNCGSADVGSYQGNQTGRPILYF